MGGRRDQILDAARACFAEHGYAATTIEQIAARSGASNGSIYHHFGAKDGILAALYVSALASYQDELLALLPGVPRLPHEAAHVLLLRPQLVDDALAHESRRARDEDHEVAPKFCQ